MSSVWNLKAQKTNSNSASEVRKAYKRTKSELKSRKDRRATNKEDPLEELEKAYTVLVDPSKRKIYDSYGIWPPPDYISMPPSSTPSKRWGGSWKATHDSVSKDRPFSIMPIFFPGFDIPPPPSPGSPDTHVPRPEVSSFIPVSESHSTPEPTSTHRPTTTPKREMPSHPDLLGGSHQRHRHQHRSEPSGTHVRESASNPFHPTRPSPSDEGSKQPTRSSSRHNSDTSHPKSYAPLKETNSPPVWVEKTHVKRVVDGVTETYIMRRDDKGKVYETLKIPRKDEKYIMNRVTHDYPPASESLRVGNKRVEELRDSHRHGESREKERTSEKSGVRQDDRKQHRVSSRRSPDDGRLKFPPPPPSTPPVYEQSPPSVPRRSYPSATTQPNQVSSSHLRTPRKYSRLGWLLMY